MSYTEHTLKHYQLKLSIIFSSTDILKDLIEFDLRIYRYIFR